MNKKMWALLVHLSERNWYSLSDGIKYTGEGLPLDEDFWEYILLESVKAGINTIVLDAEDGIQYLSHPEIAAEGAWTRKRVSDEVKRCRELGITLIPKLNFAATHSFWLGEYRRMTSTNVYYKVCRDLIKEVYEMFDSPEYIHIGMDEESAQYCAHHDYVMYRQGELYWHDLRFLMDCVHSTGAKPWLWSNPLFEHPEEYRERFDADEAILSPYYYNAFRREHWTPIESRQEYVTYYNEGKYAEMGIKFVEEDPFLVDFREKALPLMEHGYKYIPCASVFNRCDWNTHDLLEYFKENAPDEQIIGYITAPWFFGEWSKKQYFDESFKFLKEAKEKFYKNV